MKGKPDLRGFSGPAKDPTAFLEGGAADTADRTVSAARPPAQQAKPEPTVQKLFRLPWDVAQALKMGAVEQSAIQGRRVTETEIVELLIRENFGLDPKR
jgi:hypothetical protein